MGCRGGIEGDPWWGRGKKGSSVFTLPEGKSVDGAQTKEQNGHVVQRYRGKYQRKHLNEAKVLPLRRKLERERVYSLL